jgi:hypothetical protein
VVHASTASQRAWSSRIERPSAATLPMRTTRALKRLALWKSRTSIGFTVSAETPA